MTTVGVKELRRSLPIILVVAEEGRTIPALL